MKIKKIQINSKMKILKKSKSYDFIKRIKQKNIKFKTGEKIISKKPVINFKKKVPNFFPNRQQKHFDKLETNKKNHKETV